MARQTEIATSSELVCPKCGGKDIQVFPGMFVDRYMCSKCGYEWR